MYHVCGINGVHWEMSVSVYYVWYVGVHWEMYVSVYYVWYDGVHWEMSMRVCTIRVV